LARKSTPKIMKVAFGFLLGSLNGQTIQKLEEYVVQREWKTDDVTSLMRSDSLLQTGDTRELIYGMLSYRFHVDQITSIKPMNLMAYGCQCQIMSESSFGQSKDELDKVCIGWHQCRKCVSIDNELLIGSRNCNPKSDKYQIGVNVDTGDLSCQLSETACERTLCECDKMLVDNLMKNLASYDPERYIHSYNYKQECKRDNGNGGGGGGDEVGAVITAFSGPSRPGANDGPTYKSPTDKGQSAALANSQVFSHNAKYDLCCGEYPEKIPFSSRVGKRKCCGQKVFDFKRRECCPGDVISPIGEC